MSATPGGAPTGARAGATAGAGCQQAGSVQLAHRSVHDTVAAAVPRSVLAAVDRSAPLAQPWVAVALFLVAAVAAGLTALSWRRHRRRRWVGVAATAVLVATGALGAVNAYVGYIPTLPSLVGALSAGSGRIVQLDLPDRALHVSDGATYVYLPPGYQPRGHARYPVLYLLTGFPGSSVDWFRAGQAALTEQALLTAHAADPVILVAPSINNGSWTDDECLDTHHGPQLERYLTGALVHAIDHRFHTVATRAGRGLAGFSAGADCALDLGLHHLDEYGFIGSEEPSGEPGMQALHAALDGNRRQYLQHAPDHYIATMRFTRPVALFVSSGTDPTDELHRDRLAAALAARGQSVQRHTVTGQSHTWTEARTGFPYLLAAASRTFYTDTLALTGADRRHLCIAVTGARATARHPTLLTVHRSTDGRSVLLTGTLVDTVTGRPVPDQEVAVQIGSRHGRSTVATATTDTAGHFTVTLSPTTGRQPLRIRYAGSSALGSADAVLPA